MIYLHLIEKLSNKTLNFIGTLFKMNDNNFKCNVFASPNVSSKFRPRNQKLNVRKKQVGVKQVEEKVNFLVSASYLFCT